MTNWLFSFSFLVLKGAYCQSNEWRWTGWGIESPWWRLKNVSTWRPAFTPATRHHLSDDIDDFLILLLLSKICTLSKLLLVIPVLPATNALSTWTFRTPVTRIIIFNQGILLYYRYYFDILLKVVDKLEGHSFEQSWRKETQVYRSFMKSTTTIHDRDRNVLSEIFFILYGFMVVVLHLSHSG